MNLFNKITNKKNSIILFGILIFFYAFTGCKTIKIINPIQSNVWNGSYNVEIIVKESSIPSATHDTRGFYKIFIDRAKEERTNIALRSQKRKWQGKLSLDRHLIKLERWELSTATENYQRARNLLQPKPSTFYIEVKENKLTKIQIQVDQRGSRFTIKKSFFPEEKNGPDSISSTTH